jgi:hypothetical protein
VLAVTCRVLCAGCDALAAIPCRLAELAPEAEARRRLISTLCTPPAAAFLPAHIVVRASRRVTSRPNRSRCVTSQPLAPRHVTIAPAQLVCFLTVGAMLFFGNFADTAAAAAAAGGADGGGVLGGDGGSKSLSANNGPSYPTIIDHELSGLQRRSRARTWLQPQCSSSRQ